MFRGNSTHEAIEQAAEQFFSESNSFMELSRRKFASQFGISRSVVKGAFPREHWWDLQDQWALARITRAMDEVQDEAKIRERLSIDAILRRLKGSGILRHTFLRLAKDEWERRRALLPTAREKWLETLQSLIKQGITAEELTWRLVAVESGVSPNPSKWMTEAYQAAQLELHSRPVISPNTPPDGVSSITYEWGWVDLDAAVWDTRGGGGPLIERRRLRADIADHAWALMREDLLSGEFSPATWDRRFRGYILAGEMLGGIVPDITAATVEAVQRAWARYEGGVWKRKSARAAMVRLFSRLFELSKKCREVNGREMLLIAGWLTTIVVSRRARPASEFLSSQELDAVIEGCLADIRAGVNCVRAEAELKNGSRWVHYAHDAGPVQNWITALMILVMVFTGLRRQSLLKMKVGDWVRIQPGWRALRWRHGKKREEKVLVLPEALAELLDLYVQLTQPLRSRLGTDALFFTVNGKGFWRAARPDSCLFFSFRKFVKRHGLVRGMQSLPLSPQILRRTYVTRELYEGRSIWALRLQLGQESIETTADYAKLDRFEHPALTGPALDDYARKSLRLWRAPVQLTELTADERARLLSNKTERDQGVGLCRHDRCKKIDEGSLPPCSLCEHLVTGPEFLPAWEDELSKREYGLNVLKRKPGTESQLAQEKFQYEAFKANMNRIVKAENDE
jgi:integrase